MFSMVTAAVLIGALTYILTRRLDQSDSSQLSEARNSILKVGVQIVCGDCAGDNYTPVRTLLDNKGQCDQCGGRSYVLASNLALSAVLARRSRFADRRVLSFETGSRRVDRSTKVAV